MIKRFLYILLGLIIVVVLATCGGGNAGPSSNPVSSGINGVDNSGDGSQLELDASVYWDVFDAPVTATGDVIIVHGSVYDSSGNTLEGIIVEFWQTDESGVYDHPGDSGTNGRDLGFQFFGTSTTDSEGQYAFRTLRPGRYEPRPPHIHVKIKFNDIILLVTQIYFADVGSEGGIGAGADQLEMVVEEAETSGGETILIGEFDFVLDVGSGGGTMSLTPAQGEGPYYPVVDFSGYDSDLASVGEN